MMNKKIGGGTRTHQWALFIAHCVLQFTLETRAKEVIINAKINRSNNY